MKSFCKDESCPIALVSRGEGLIHGIVQHVAGEYGFFCPYCECTPLYSATYHNTGLINSMIEKGAGPNTVSWIASDEIPSTPLDSVADDINAYGSDLDLQESFCLYRKSRRKILL